MLYILQTAIPEERILKKGLLSIYGLGQSSVINSILSLGISKNARGKDLRRFHRVMLKSNFNDYARNLGSDLIQSTKSSIRHHITIKSYRGRRHKKGLPVRGQRTHTNAKTQKRLYKRWDVNTFQKTKFIVNQKKQVLTSKHKTKPSVKPKPLKKVIPKQGKYKI